MEDHNELLIFPSFSNNRYPHFNHKPTLLSFFKYYFCEQKCIFFFFEFKNLKKYSYVSNKYFIYLERNGVNYSLLNGA